MRGSNLTIFGSQQDLEKMTLLLRNEEQFDPIIFSKTINKTVISLQTRGVVIVANRKTIGSASKVLELISEYHRQLPVVVVSEIKDVDLLFYSLKVNLIDFIVDCGNHVTLKKNLSKSISLLKEKGNLKNILAIGAHPDDIEIGCGGALLKHKKQNHNISILTLTQGSIGGDKDQRIREAQNAANFLDAELFLHDLEDTKISEGNPTIDLIQNAIQQCNPDIIYTHSYNDNHQDHRAVHKATLVAARGVTKMFAYLAPSTNMSFHPNHFEIIENYIDEKLELINFHVSQTTVKARPYLKPSIIESTAIYWGRYSNYLQCEPFEVIKS